MADLPTALQILQGLGAGVGLITGVFYFGERLIRHYPTAFVVVRPLMPGGAHKEPFLRVQNHATRPILISWRSGSQDNRFKIAKGSTTLDYIATTRDGEQWFLLDAGEVVELVLHRPPNYASLPVRCSILAIALSCCSCLFSISTWIVSIWRRVSAGVSWRGACCWPSSSCQRSMMRALSSIEYPETRIRVSRLGRLKQGRERPVESR